MEAVMRALRSFHERHERLKHTVHTAWRYPLPRWGQYAMGCFYFSIPVVGGWYVMQWAISRSVDEIGERGEKLRHKRLRGSGKEAVIDGREEAVGAGGRFGGVNLAASDASTQDQNRKMLEEMFRRERRRRGKDRREDSDSQPDADEGRR